MVNGINREQLAHLTEEIWSSMLGIDLAAVDHAPELGKKVSACVQILGEWEGAVRLDCSEALARVAAATFIGVEPPEVAPEQIRDAAGELANMTGGNFKTLLPKPCKLSLPSVADGDNFSLTIPNGKLVLESIFSGDSGSLIVSVFERAD